MKPTDWQTLQKKLNYRFTNLALLKQALTHRSHSITHNERLEYLGDALLETIISIELYRRHPQAPEGNLTRLRAAIVKGSNLAKIAKQLALGEYLQLGDGERKSGGSRRETILADAVEAIIAAVYLDSDFALCESFTLALFEQNLEALPDAEALKDAKTRLQEYLQGRGLPLPIYTLEKESGPEHNRKFTVSASSENYRSEATATNRKKAEQAAAESLLLHYRKS
ncbi:ribonuclease III [Suttonella ornithocola]|uniref:Ribonuclease 3 n=1 Tax=Suttonella ornithocola TaxID=279832 RepID=A0A380MW19_9GAMM|nr:ribonuclease III [Suttonella ornithocola]SUO95597.1 Ribonuclease 3 [Suttonella ornithocola]